MKERSVVFHLGLAFGVILLVYLISNLFGGGYLLSPQEDLAYCDPGREGLPNVAVEASCLSACNSQPNPGECARQYNLLTTISGCFPDSACLARWGEENIGYNCKITRAGESYSFDYVCDKCQRSSLLGLLTDSCGTCKLKPRGMFAGADSTTRPA